MTILRDVDNLSGLLGGPIWGGSGYSDPYVQIDCTGSRYSEQHGHDVTDWSGTTRGTTKPQKEVPEKGRTVNGKEKDGKANEIICTYMIFKDKRPLEGRVVLSVNVYDKDFFGEDGLLSRQVIVKNGEEEPINDWGAKITLDVEFVEACTGEEVTGEETKRIIIPSRDWQTSLNLDVDEKNLPTMLCVTEIIPSDLKFKNPNPIPEISEMDIDGLKYTVAEWTFSGDEIKDRHIEYELSEPTFPGIYQLFGYSTTNRGKTAHRGDITVNFWPELITVDTNDIPIYEPQDMGGPPLMGPTDGQLQVSLGWRPGDPTYPPFTATVTVDPNPNQENVGSADFTFPDSTEPNGNITLTFTEADWDVPQNVLVQAVADLDREGNENYPIELTVTIDIDDPNFGSDPCSPVTQTRGIIVVDNDIPYILTVPSAIEDQLSENDPCVPYCFDVSLSHMPNEDVYVLVHRESYYDVLLDSMSVMDPPLGEADDPNRLHFTPATYNINQQICLEALDDDELAEAWEEWILGQIVFTPYSEDLRYLVSWLNPDGTEAPIIPDDPCDPCGPREPDSGGEAEETIIYFNVQDNECGAWGYDALDFDEDCYVNLVEFALLAREWLMCVQPFVDGCDKLWNLLEEE